GEFGYGSVFLFAAIAAAAAVGLSSFLYLRDVKVGKMPAAL
ncbi:MAG: MFS transporter, partial [Paraburkholderia caledonica]